MTVVNFSDFFDVLKNLLASSKILNYKPNMNEAIVFDLDGTIVFDGTWDTPILPITNFIKHCNDLNISVIIITARPGFESNINNTRNSLQKLAINCDRFFFKNPDFKDIKEFKINARNYVTDILKHNILMSIGDNSWDMGKYGGLGILMNANIDSNQFIDYKIFS